jgi:RND family efflux transporter MFP subunit
MRVQAGQLVAALEPREYELRVAQAEAALAAARALLGLPAQGDGERIATEETAVFRLAAAQLEEARLRRERAQTLAEEGVDSQAALDTAEAELRAAESRLQEARELVESRRAALAQRRAELEIARAQLDETRVEAPFDGVVAARLAATGAYLAAGAPIAELVRADPVRVRLEVSEREAGAVSAGQRVRLELAGSGGDGPEQQEAELVRVAPRLERGSRTLVVEAELENQHGRLRPGAFVRARIVLDPGELAPSLPLEALRSFAGRERVLVLLPETEGGRRLLEERAVEVGRRNAQLVEILSGLREGEEVVLSPGNLSAGTAVSVGS